MPEAHRLMHRIIRYLISGGVSVGVNLLVLYISTEWFGLWYLVSASIAYLVGFLVSFTLQKFWTFQNKSTDSLWKQAGIYFCIILVNLGINTVGMYVLVEQLHVWYVLAQFVLLALISIESYFLYRALFRSNITSLPGRADSV